MSSPKYLIMNPKIIVINENTLDAIVSKDRPNQAKILLGIRKISLED